MFRRTRRDTWFGWLLATAVAVFVVAVVLFLWFFGVIRPEPATTTEDIVLRPAAHAGANVRLGARVTHVLEPGLFMLGADAPAGSLPVFVPAENRTAREFAAALTVGDAVAVHGTVRLVEEVAPAASTRPGWLDQLTEAYNGEAVVIASAVGEIELVPITAIAADPGSYLGRLVRVKGPVSAVLSENAVVLGRGQGTSLLVVGHDPLDRTTGRDETTFTGMIRAFEVGYFESELFVDLEDDRFDAWKGRPALLLERDEPG